MVPNRAAAARPAWSLNRRSRVKAKIARFASSEFTLSTRAQKRDARRAYAHAGQVPGMLQRRVDRPLSVDALFVERRRDEFTNA